MRALAVVLVVVSLAGAAGWVACAFLQPAPYITWPVWGVAIVSGISAVIISRRTL